MPATKSPANELTHQITAHVLKDKAYGFRLNSTGIWNPTTRSFRASSATKGVSDVIICYRGHLVACEVKIGSDRQRPEQVGFQSNIEHTGGIYMIAKTFEQFCLDWKIIKEKIDKEYNG